MYVCMYVDIYVCMHACMAHLQTRLHFVCPHNRGLDGMRSSPKRHRTGPVPQVACNQHGKQQHLINGVLPSLRLIVTRARPPIAHNSCNTEIHEYPPGFNVLFFAICSQHALPADLAYTAQHLHNIQVSISCGKVHGSPPSATPPPSGLLEDKARISRSKIVGAHFEEILAREFVDVQSIPLFLRECDIQGALGPCLTNQADQGLGEFRVLGQVPAARGPRCSNVSPPQSKGVVAGGNRLLRRIWKHLAISKKRVVGTQFPGVSDSLFRVIA